MITATTTPLVKWCISHCDMSCIYHFISYVHYEYFKVSVLLLHHWCTTRTTDHGQATGKLYHLRLRVECTLSVIYKAGRDPTPYWWLACIIQLQCTSLGHPDPEIVLMI
jgi:hypothetical protein